MITSFQRTLPLQALKLRLVLQPYSNCNLNFLVNLSSTKVGGVGGGIAGPVGAITGSQTEGIIGGGGGAVGFSAQGGRMSGIITSGEQIVGGSTTGGGQTSGTSISGSQICGGSTGGGQTYGHSTSGMMHEGGAMVEGTPIHCCWLTSKVGSGQVEHEVHDPVPALHPQVHAVVDSASAMRRSEMITFFIMNYIP